MQEVADNCKKDIIALMEHPLEGEKQSNQYARGGREGII